MDTNCIHSIDISTHSPREGRSFVDFLFVIGIIISTHSPREGRSHCLQLRKLRIPHFNSLAPRGAILTISTTRRHMYKFQLTRPARGDPSGAGLFASCSIFQLTRPARGDPVAVALRESGMVISTHSPREGRSRPFAGIKHSSSVYALMQDIRFDGTSVFGPCAIHIEQPPSVRTI